MENIMKSELLPAVGFVRIKTILRIFPISRSSWYQGVADGKFPRPIRLGVRTSVWRVQDIRELINKFGGEQ